MSRSDFINEAVFLSTPSARRATLPVLLRSSYDIRISIHALREEGDWSFG